MRCVSVKFIPQLLTAEQENCLSVHFDFLECTEADKNFFKSIVTQFQIKNTMKGKYVRDVKMITCNMVQQLLKIVWEVLSGME